MTGKHPGRGRYHRDSLSALVGLDGVGEALVPARRYVASRGAAAASLQLPSHGDEPGWPNRHFGLQPELDHVAGVVERVADPLRAQSPQARREKP